MLNPILIDISSRRNRIPRWSLIVSIEAAFKEGDGTGGVIRVQRLYVYGGDQIL